MQQDLMVEQTVPLTLVTNTEDGFPILPRCTIRDLVSIADAIPTPRVIDALCYYGRRLCETVDRDRRSRYLIVIGALAQRGAFEVMEIAHDADLTL